DLELANKMTKELFSTPNGHFFNSLLRVHQGVSTRHTEERPSELPVTISVDGKQSQIMLPVDDHPYFLVLPVWSWPGLMRDEQPQKEFTGLTNSVYYHFPNNIKDTFKGYKNKNFKVGPDNRNIDVEQFARALAKIALLLDDSSFWYLLFSTAGYQRHYSR
ncbi:MAG TPA: hypothetical protein VKS78_00410, partial [Roseiarcus sp.]|nr:hypothetical protein [Roseiarcus sp.]